MATNLRNSWTGLDADVRGELHVAHLSRKYGLPASKVARVIQESGPSRDHVEIALVELRRQIG